ncbi:MAG: ferric reductase-like transmembrane domain-containing protein [Alphaproteobacteria bacterium]|nr:ferric reductase-like transmembrane domain-containing protein [Alphaproteobacteria bacterium]
MSVKYIPVQWNPNKYVYDAVLLLAVVAYLWIYIRLGNPMADVSRPVDGPIVRMRAFGSCAFLMLTVILCIGPLARLDRRFLPLLYNRRHFGVITAVVALTHASFVINWYFVFSDVPPYEALLTSNTSYGQLLGFPFEAFGVFALITLGILAATSHDFWLSFLSAPVWKSIHLLIYPAYAAVTAHVALGALQEADSPMSFALYVGGPLLVAALHFAAWSKRDKSVEPEGDWLEACKVSDIPDQRAVIVRVGPKDRAAIFRDGDRLSAISNACAHQNGPLGDGRIIDGCVTCPWHGFQYRLEDGCSPAPFNEKVPTYRLKLEGDSVFIDRNGNIPGTPVEPLTLPDGLR